MRLRLTMFWYNPRLFSYGNYAKKMMLVLEQHDWHNKARRGVSNKNGLLVRQDEGGDKANSLACKQALLFGRAKRVSRERASERRSREGQRLRRSLARSRETRFARPNRRACSQATKSLTLPPNDAITWTETRSYITASMIMSVFERLWLFNLVGF